MDIKSLLAGAAGGGGTATLVVGLIMSNMATSTKALEGQVIAMTRELRAENKLGLEQIKNVSARMDRVEDIGNKTTDRIEKKLDKMIDSIQIGIKDRWSKSDHINFENQLTNENDTFKSSLNLRIDRIEERLLQQSNELNIMNKNNKKGI